MDSKTLGITALVIIILAVVAGAMLFSKGGGSTATTSVTSSTVQGGGKVTITGSGSSFIAPQIYAWSDQLKAKSNVVVEYESVGSGAGVSNFIKGIKDFGASDPPLPEDLYQKYQGKVIQMPVILGAVVIVYNIPGVDQSLNLTGEVIAEIYKGTIEYWDDPKIKQLNPNVDLPHEQIIAVHRSDASGTTQVFTTFLHKAAPDVWGEDLVGKTVQWPVDSTGRGVAQKGNEGVTETVKTTPYAIGYIEWSYALDSGLPMAALQNAKGEFVLPSLDAIKKAAEGLPLPDSPLGDYTQAVQALIYSDSDGAYPIASFSFLIFWTEYPQEKVDAVKTFIKYVNTDGQNPANIVKGYAPVPDQIRQVNLKALDLIKAKG